MKRIAELPCAVLILALTAVQLGGCGGGNKAAEAAKPAQLFPNPPSEEETKPLDRAVSDAMSRGTEIEVELADVIDSDTSPIGGLAYARVTENVRGNDGKVAVPEGTSSTVSVLRSSRTGGDSFLELALYQLTIENRSYLLMRSGKPLAVLEFRDSAAKGEGHRSVHLQRASRFRFTLSEPVALKR